MYRCLVTGSHGLIGREITRRLLLDGYEVRGFDRRLPETHHNYGDIRDQVSINSILRDVDAIVHLAAISRVQWGDAHPELCWEINVLGTQRVIAAAVAAERKPVLLIASSREVYGEPIALPVHEDAPVAPINLYGRSKVACEEAAFAAREAGINTAIVRFSNVYGSTADHHDRVVP